MVIINVAHCNPHYLCRKCLKLVMIQYLHAVGRNYVQYHSPWNTRVSNHLILLCVSKVQLTTIRPRLHHHVNTRLHEHATLVCTLLTEERRKDDIGRGDVNLPGQVQSENEQPELFLFSSVPRVRDLVITVLVTREHPNRDRLSRYQPQICNRTKNIQPGTIST